MSTIAAIASPPGPGRRGIVRLSGPGTARLLERVLATCEPPLAPEAERSLHEGRLDDGRGAQPVRVLWMRGPRSYTREDVAELHLAGAEALLAAAFERVLACGARAALAGEFTRRAFENGRLDLSQAEGVLALTEASGEAERRAATGLLTGGLERRTRALREGLLDLASLCEASLDFDEAETGHVATEELALRAAAVEAELAEALRWELARAAPVGLPRVVLVGAPSVGKSTLWNALTGGRALVSEHAGTTRDYLEGTWPLGDGACRLIDGPGVTAAEDELERRAQELFANARAAADLVVFVGDAADPGPPPPDAGVLVAARADRAGGCTPPAGFLTVSARTGAGLEVLGARVAGCLGLSPESAEAGLERALHRRHRQALVLAREALARARAGLAEGQALDLVAEALREARGALDDLAGRTTPEDVLEHLFARFCIGK
jgi:tRNA modification GTPase